MFYDLRQEYRLPIFPPKYFFSVLIEKYLWYHTKNTSYLVSTSHLLLILTHYFRKFLKLKKRLCYRTQNPLGHCFAKQDVPDPSCPLWVVRKLQ